MGFGRPDSFRIFRRPQVGPATRSILVGATPQSYLYQPAYVIDHFLRLPAVRLAGYLTPFRGRGPCRTEHRGQVRGDREAWFCAAGLLDAETARPAATYPRDLFNDSSPKPWLDKHLNLSAGLGPPALWTSAPHGSSATPPPRAHQLSWFD